MTNVVPQPNDVVSTIREQHAQVGQLIGAIKAAAPVTPLLTQTAAGR